MIFPQINAPLRTDAEFRSGAYERHHKTRTIIEKINGIDMINSFPIGDALHLIDLGITKRFLMGWKMGTLNNYNAKWSANDIKNVSMFLRQTKLPREFNRPFRGLEEIAFWKGTEFRAFLLYASLVIVKEFFTEAVIADHFLNFYCAVIICSRHDQRCNYKYARQMLNDFLKGVKILYGAQLFTSNMHNLCHLMDDVERFGPLDTFNAYPFESKLCYVKRLVRHGKLPLSQISRRIIEIQQNLRIRGISRNEKPRLLRSFDPRQIELHPTLFNFLQLNKCKLFNFIQLKDFCINAVSDSNKWILTTDFRVMRVKYILQWNENINFFFGYPLSAIEDYFTKPVRSSLLQIYVSDMCEGDPEVLRVEEIYCKMIKVNCFIENSKAIFMPLIHTLL